MPYTKLVKHPVVALNHIAFDQDQQKYFAKVFVIAKSKLPERTFLVYYFHVTRVNVNKVHTRPIQLRTCILKTRSSGHGVVARCSHVMGVSYIHILV